jgi:hypothetical protein
MGGIKFMYKATFDSQGNRITSYHTDVHTDIPTDAIEISDEDQELYATNEYIRGTDGRPVTKPMVVITKAQKLSSLNDIYNPQILSLNTQISIAVSATKNPASETSLRSSLVSLQAEYNTKKAAIMNGTA